MKHAVKTLPVGLSLLLVVLGPLWAEGEGLAVLHGGHRYEGRPRQTANFLILF